MIIRILLAVMLLASSLQLMGCFALVAGAAAGAGGIIWVKGTMEQTVNTNLDRVYKSTKNTLKRLELKPTLDNKDKMSAKVESAYADGKHVWITLEYVTQQSTKITVRVGTLGDETRTQEIMDRIVSGL